MFIVQNSSQQIHVKSLNSAIDWLHLLVWNFLSHTSSGALVLTLFQLTFT